MSPENAACLSAAQIDCCVLANNHVLDWGRKGLLDTLTTLERLGIKVAGAGRILEDADTPAVLEIAGKGRVVVFAFASTISGTPRSWAAKPDAPGVNVLSDLSEMTAIRIADRVARARQPGDVIVVSLHWGANWGFEVPEEQQRFAHTLIDEADASIVYGHSSHHAKAIEVYRNRLILYGCGDFLNDYEGIAGNEDYRDDLGLLYCADVEPESGTLAALEIVPLQIRKFQLVQPSGQDMSWVQQTLDGESRRFGTRVMRTTDGRLTVS
jgi:poly-gamma-glutamate synthesis protein (capsule biosynthesis protein)